MSDNLTVKDGANATKYLATKEVSTDIHVPKHMPTDSAGTPIDPATSTAQATTNTGIGAPGDTSASSDGGTFSLIALAKRINARITSMIATQPAALGQTTKSASFPVVIASDDDLQAKLGSLTETAPASDTASSGLNGRLQRIAQRITSLIAQIPAALTGSGNFKVAVQEALPAGEAVLGKALGVLINPSANFTRPGDTTAYALGDLTANSTTAGSVTPLSWTAARIAAGNFYIRRARFKKSTNTLTNASFRLHLYGASPTCANGDNAAWSTTESTYYGAIDVTFDKQFSDPAATGNGIPNTGGEINIALASGQTIYGLLEARAAYAPGNAETFTVVLEIHQN